MRDNFLSNSLLHILSSTSGDQVNKRISAQYSLPFWREKWRWCQFQYLR